MFYPVNPNGVPSCADCGFLDECGGLDGDDFHRGCFQRCNTHCALHGCDVTAVDATPFMKTVKRQILYSANGFWKWRRKRTPHRHSISGRLAHNIEFHRNRQLQRIGRAPQAADGQYWMI